MTMVAARRPGHLIDQLPAVRGRYEADADLARRSWFRTGGPAEVLFTPAGVDDLQAFMAARPDCVPVTVIGFGSNLLIRDGGVEGVVILLGEAFAGITFEDATVTAGGGALDVAVARAAQRHGIAGLEFLSGIPGTVGGAFRMNAGAYGSEIADVAIDATVIDGDGAARVLTCAQLGFGYRRSALPADCIVVSGRLCGRAGDAAEIADRMAAIAAARSESQPRTRTGGSTFANPPGEKAWELIDRAGCRGLRRGGAMVSEQHCNFLINSGDATSADIELLGEEVRCRVLEETGVHLEWEIRRIGRPLREACA